MSPVVLQEPVLDLRARLIEEIFEWRDDEAHIGSVSIEHLAQQYGTPLYVYDSGVLTRQYERLRRALPEAIEIYYSIKANPHPSVIGVLVQLGAGCEIASGGEYVTARRGGARSDRIVFAGPGKGREELEYVVSQGIGEIHIESLEEIEALEDIAKRLGTTIDVAVRVNPSAAAGGGLLMGGQATAFGFEEESLQSVVAAVGNRGRLRLRGVHLYTGTQILDAESLLSHWRHAIEVAKEVSKLAGMPLATIDLGGGLGIPYFAHEKELDLQVLGSGARALVAAARRDPGLMHARFVVEPGRFLTAPAGVYVARVRSVKSCRGTTFVVLDGGMNHNLAASGNLGQVVRRDYPIVKLSKSDPQPRESVVVVGPLCTPIDTLGRKVEMERPRAGDLLGVLQSGAYGLTASPVGFLSHPTPAEVMVTQGNHQLITPRGRTFEEVAP